jgi:protein TonB
VQRSVRVPAQLQGFVSGPITVKFAIRPDGKPDLFSPQTAVPDQRISNEIWRAIQSCRWVPGADARGKPVSIWVILPIRFTAG